MRPARSHKYGAKPQECSAGHKHPSRKEARRCEDLRLLERAGEITHLEVEPKFYFVINGAELKHDNGRRARFTPDFSYREPNGTCVAEDVKGGTATRTEAYVLRRALFRHLFPAVELREI